MPWVLTEIEPWIRLPFAVKLNSELVKEIQALAQSRNASVNDVVAELLQKGLKS